MLPVDNSIFEPAVEYGTPLVAASWQLVDVKLPEIISEASILVTFTVVASIVPVVICPPSIIVVVSSFNGVVQVSVPPIVCR